MHPPQLQGEEELRGMSIQDGETHGFKLRDYQYEMLEESLQQNIIVAMDTGSGKTMIAVMRMHEQLQRRRPGQIVWFLVPTVALAEQQHAFIVKLLCAYRVRMLTGSDNCEFWSHEIWHAVLAQEDVIISTYAILLDALKHGYVVMEKIALLVFDEAHHATKRHPSNLIMKDFYHHLDDSLRPEILGLSASPIIRDDIRSLQQLESNLNAISRTPKKHRDILERHVHRATLETLIYHDVLSALYVQTKCAVLDRLNKIIVEYDIESDPWIKRMRTSQSVTDKERLEKALEQKTTHTLDQITSLWKKGTFIHLELGCWAAEIFVSLCLDRFFTEKSNASSISMGLREDEASFLRNKLRSLEAPSCESLRFTAESRITSKTQCLIDIIGSQVTKVSTALLFVTRRSEVAVLTQLLTMHPSTAHVTVGSFVGTASLASARKLGELADRSTQKIVLGDLQNGTIQLIIATNALEEGIDVCSCNMVICLDVPKTLRSFIQRRGRARDPTSRYLVLRPENLSKEYQFLWEEMERTMKEAYGDDTREVVEAEEEQAAYPDQMLSNEITGARLTPFDTISHLFHFCQSGTTDPYVNTTPTFFLEEVSKEDYIKYTARVVLPSFVDKSVREAQGRGKWLSRDAAKRDASFEAYAALHRANFLNEHLLPRVFEGEAHQGAKTQPLSRPNMVKAAAQLHLWPEIASQWTHSEHIYASRILIDQDHGALFECYMILPTPLPPVESFELFWKADSRHQVRIEKNVEKLKNDRRADFVRATEIILRSAYNSRMQFEANDFTVLWTPTLDRSALAKWLEQVDGFVDISETDDFTTDQLIRHKDFGKKGLVLKEVLDVDVTQYLDNRLNKFAIIDESTLVGQLNHSDSASRPATSLSDITSESCKENRLVRVARVENAPKCRRFHEHVNQTSIRGSKKLLLLKECQLSRLSFDFFKLALFTPSILHSIHRACVANRLYLEVLPRPADDIFHPVLVAITTSSASEGHNYQRLEFLGDSILKLMTSLTFLSLYPTFHEGILSRNKDHIVANGRLSRAALQCGLDRFILTKQLATNKWKPYYNSRLTNIVGEEQRDMSTKILADVVEAIIGLTYSHGGYVEAKTTLEVLLPDVQWQTIEDARGSIRRRYIDETQISTSTETFERLIGYSFDMKHLLYEAITHASYQSFSSCASYQRLEFLGDAVLDNIVTVMAFYHHPPVSESRLHHIRSTVVNGNYLGFLCYRHSTTIDSTKIVSNGETKRYKIKVEVEPVRKEIYLWELLRHTSHYLTEAREKSFERLAIHEDQISEQLQRGKLYPWVALAQIEPPKPYSDMIESILGAIYIDSSGSMERCTEFLENIGLLTYLRRVLAEDIHLVHPKEELGRLSLNEKIRYDVEARSTLNEADGSTKKALVCNVVMGERVLSTIEDGRALFEVQTRAAAEACRLIKAENEHKKGLVEKQTSEPALLGNGMEKGAD